jgi:uncharacterized protein (DUF849 family)
MASFVTLISNKERDMFLKACLNGSREPGEHPQLPLTADELARAAQSVIEAGAHAVHIHPRGADGKQSLDARDQAATIAAIRAHCPGLPVGVSTAIWIEPDVQRRLASIQAWTILPDFASVNFDEPGIDELCALLFARGIGVEVGLSAVEDVQLLWQPGIADRCLRILIEPIEEEAQAALATTEAIVECLDEARIQLPRLLHGFETTAWPVLNVALQRGYDTRIGLEDTLLLSDGRLAKNNAELVALVRQQAQQMGLL